jgi:hypothetical protein
VEDSGFPAGSRMSAAKTTTTNDGTSNLVLIRSTPSRHY